jgi:hypothetical protein
MIDRTPVAGGLKGSIEVPIGFVTEGAHVVWLGRPGGIAVGRIASFSRVPFAASPLPPAGGRDDRPDLSPEPVVFALEQIRDEPVAAAS